MCEMSVAPDALAVSDEHFVGCVVAEEHPALAARTDVCFLEVATQLFFLLNPALGTSPC